MKEKSIDDNLHVANIHYCYHIYIDRFKKPEIKPTQTKLQNQKIVKTPNFKTPK